MAEHGSLRSVSLWPCASLWVGGGLYTLQVSGNLTKRRRIAIDVKGPNIGGIRHVQLLFEKMGEVGGRYWRVSLGSLPFKERLDRPSEAIEAPERRKSSEPIWMEKTFSDGKLQDCLVGCRGEEPDSGGGILRRVREVKRESCRRS